MTSWEFIFLRRGITIYECTGKSYNQHHPGKRIQSSYNSSTSNPNTYIEKTTSNLHHRSPIPRHGWQNASTV